MVSVQREHLVDVRDHGATGDGMTDDTAAIQSALDASGGQFDVPTAPGTTGAAVYFPRGVYRAGGLVAPVNIEIYGDGYGASVIKANATGAPVLTVSDFTTLRDLRVDGDMLNVTLVRVDMAARVTVGRIYLENTSGGGNALEFYGTDQAHSSHAAKVSQLTVINVGGTGIKLGGGFTYDSQFSDVWVARCGVGVDVGSGGTFWSNVHVWGCSGHGVVLTDAKYTKVVNGYFESNGGAGVHVVAGRGSVFTNCDMWSNGNGGAVVGSSSFVRFVGGMVRSNVGPGIAYVDSLNGSVTGCDFWDYDPTKRQTYAVTSTGTSDYLTISNCHMAAADHVAGSHSLVGVNNRVDKTVVTGPDRTEYLGNYAVGQQIAAGIKGDAGTVRDLSFLSGSSLRWVVRANAAAESGGNVGSDLEVIARDDTGASIGAVIGFTRSDRAVTIPGRVKLGSAAGPQILSGSGSPEGVKAAPVGSLFLRSDGGIGSTLYVKERGTDSSGWAAK